MEGGFWGPRGSSGGFIRGGGFSPGLVDALHRHLITYPDHLDVTWKRQLFFTLLDFTGSGVAKGEGRNGLLKTTVDPTVPGNRVTGQLLAAVADAAERSLANSTWRNPNAGGTEYLTLLVAHTGYQLSDVEVLAMKATNPKWTPPKTAPRSATTGKAAAAGTEGQGKAARPRSVPGTTDPGAPKPGPGGTPLTEVLAPGAQASTGTPARTATPPTAPAATPAAAATAKKPAASARKQ